MPRFWGCTPRPQPTCAARRVLTLTADYEYKMRRSLPAERQKVIALPVVVTFQRPVNEPSVTIVLACDGVWDVASVPEVGIWLNGPFLTPEAAASAAASTVFECLDRKSCDNISCAILVLPDHRRRRAAEAQAVARHAPTGLLRGQALADAIGASFARHACDVGLAVGRSLTSRRHVRTLKLAVRRVKEEEEEEESSRI